MFKKFYEWAAKIREKLNEKGQGMVEYALILAAVAIIAVVAIWGTASSGVATETGATSLKAAVSNAFTNAASKIDDAQKTQKTGS